MYYTTLANAAFRSRRFPSRRPRSISHSLMIDITRGAEPRHTVSYRYPPHLRALRLTHASRTASTMFALTTPSASIAACRPRAPAPRRARAAVVARAGEAPEARRASALASATLAGALLFAPALTPAAFAEGGACFKSCESECLKLAPGSGDYCASACADECAAMKEENGGEEVDSGAFGMRQEKGDFENLLDKMLDTQKVFFVGPSSAMKKAADAQ